jgi:hypothetical protein
LDASKKFFSLGSFSEKKFSNKNSFRDESRLVFSGSILVENKPRMQRQLISADLGRIRDKPKVRDVGLVRSQEGGHNHGDMVAADLPYTGRIVKAYPQSHFEVTSGRQQ